MAFTKASSALALDPAGNCLSPPSVPFLDSLDAHNSKSELLPSSPPYPLPQCRPRKAVATASTKASSAPRKRGLNFSAEQLQDFKAYFERGMTNGSSRSLGWREEVQVSTGVSMQQVNVCINMSPTPLISKDTRLLISAQQKSET